MGLRDRRLLILVCTCLLSAFFVGGAVKTAGLFSDVVAGWLQAIFSVLAIYAVWETSERQRMAAVRLAERQLAATAEQAEIARRVAAAARAHERTVLIANCKGASESYRSVLEWLTKQLENTPLQRLAAATNRDLINIAIDRFLKAPTDQIGDVFLLNIANRVATTSPYIVGFFDLRDELAGEDAGTIAKLRTTYSDHVHRTAASLAAFELRLDELSPEGSQ